MAVEAAAVGVLQGAKRQSAGLADFVDLEDIGVLQPGGGFGFGQKAGHLIGGGEAAGPDHLEGDGALEGQVQGLVNDAHAATAQQALDQVAGDDRRTAATSAGARGVRRDGLRRCGTGL